MPEKQFGIPRATVLLWWTQWLFPAGILLHKFDGFVRQPSLASVLRIEVLLALVWIAASVLVLRTRKGRVWVLRWGQQVGLATIALCTTLLLAEAGLRVAFYRSLFPDFGGPMQALRQPHPTRGWALTPNGHARRDTLDYSVTVRTNAHGQRDIEHDYRPAKGVFRVVVLGDSSMEAYQVELNQSLPRRLQRRLSGRNVETVNLGVGGYGTAQEYVALLEDGLRYEPDLVLLAFFAFNDVRNNHRWLEGHLRSSSVSTMRTFGRPYALAEPDSEGIRIEYPDYNRISSWVEEQRRTKVRYLEDISLIAKLGQNALARLGTGKERELPTHDPNIWLGTHILGFAAQEQISEAEYARQWQQGWDISLRLITATRDLAQKNGAQFAIFLVPHVIEVDDGEFADIAQTFPYITFDRRAASARVLDYCDANAIPALDLAPVFRNQLILGHGPYYHKIADNRWNAEGWNAEGWNAEGHALATGALIEFLDQNGLLPEPPQ